VGIDDGTSVASRTFRLPGQREHMRQMSVITALDYLRRHLTAAE
jgi:nicotinamide mononucleotide (NMN) deamidase PncC